ncbi:c-type cytochrome [Salinisphaera sp. T31B1]|uniref:c-type cytochrome n=1 Tax=Salinisphaera sp. T31B1 TaxID=727963 RepID=UPI00333F4FC9
MRTAAYLLIALAVGCSASMTVFAAERVDAQVERGEYLARAADCAACHTAKGGTPYAGGHPIDTPFGTVYGTNITPDKQYGIGDYSADDFYHVLTQGELPDGTQLYPAMPYTAYHDIAREDSDAMYAYFMSLDGVHAAGPQTDLSWPFSMRWTLNVWNWMFAGSDTSGPPADDDPQSGRGRYLVDTLGHCGQCHTPRNMLGAVESDKRLQGAVIAGYEAPNLLPTSLASRGWDTDSLRTFLREGRSRQGSMYSEMYPVFHHSTRYLNDADLAAMTGYLLGAEPPAPKTISAATDLGDDPGRQLYLNSCAGCHGAQGQGAAQVASAMTGNTTLRLDSPRNLVKIIHDGIAARQFNGTERAQAMPGFADKLSDDEIATLATYLRRQWGGQKTPVDATQVADMTDTKQ